MKRFNSLKLDFATLIFDETWLKEEKKSKRFLDVSETFLEEFYEGLKRASHALGNYYFKSEFSYRASFGMSAKVEILHSESSNLIATIHFSINSMSHYRSNGAYGIVKAFIDCFEREF